MSETKYTTPTGVQNIQQIIEQIPLLYPGPGGAVAVLKDGKLIGEYVWGYADLDQRIQMSSTTQMPICSCTKQMLCMVLINLKYNPTSLIAEHGSLDEQISTALKSLLPEELTRNNQVTMDYLADNQSGIRDYWATAMLCGAKLESRFTLENEAKIMRETTTSFHFEPGTEYSYCNLNFHLLARALEMVSNESIESLLTQHIFGPAKMTNALFRPDTSQLPPPCIGYEGNQQVGFIPGKNNIVWSGDAGAVASLADMIAYEQFFDRIWTDPGNQIRTVGESRTYKDGKPARYRYGLVHSNIDKLETVGHGGAIRGFRCHRRYVKQERLSVVVMFNHETDAAGADEYIIRQALSLQRSDRSVVEPSKDWFENFLDEGTQLLVTVRPDQKGGIVINYAWDAESPDLIDASHAQSADIVANISGNSLRIERLEDNRVLEAERLVKAEPPSPQGNYYCASLKSTFTCQGYSNVFYGTFDGPLGRSIPEMLKYIGGNVWTLECARALDAPAPGPWTLVFHQDNHGTITSVTIGCWLARHLNFEKL